MRFVLTILAVAVVSLGAVACGGDSGTSPTILPGAPFSTTDVRVGTGADATAGRRVTVNYTGWIYDPARPENKGQQFDTSVGAGRQPYSFPLGTGAVIRGFDQGVIGIQGPKDVAAFVTAAKNGRVWDREPKVRPAF